MNAKLSRTLVVALALTLSVGWSIFRRMEASAATGNLNAPSGGICNSRTIVDDTQSSSGTAPSGNSQDQEPEISDDGCAGIGSDTTYIKRNRQQ